MDSLNELYGQMPVLDAVDVPNDGTEVRKEGEEDSDAA